MQAGAYIINLIQDAVSNTECILYTICHLPGTDWTYYTGASSKLREQSNGNSQFEAEVHWECFLTALPGPKFCRTLRAQIIGGFGLTICRLFPAALPIAVQIFQLTVWDKRPNFVLQNKLRLTFKNKSGVWLNKYKTIYKLRNTGIHRLIIVVQPSKQ